MLSMAEILDIRGRNTARVSDSYSDFNGRIRSALLQPTGEKSLPTVLLYDERGLRLYDYIATKTPEYYLFALEEDILKNHADDIVQVMHLWDGGAVTGREIVLELGAGGLRKTSLLLLALSKLVPATTSPAPIVYHALDLEKSELQRTLAQLITSDVGKYLKGKVETKGLCATYDDCLKFIEEGGLERLLPETWSAELHQVSMDPSCGLEPTGRSYSSDDATSPPSTLEAPQPPLHIMFLGSSLGNFSRTESAQFLRSLPLRAGLRDTLLLGLDHDNDPEKFEIAYNDPAGHTRRFIMNGLRNAGRILGDENLFNEDKWEYVGRYNIEQRRHEAYYRSRDTQIVKNPCDNEEYTFAVDELVRIEVSHKYSDADAYRLFAEANLRPVQRWTDPAFQYSLWLLERPAFTFPMTCTPSNPSETGPFGVPTLSDWETLWAAWDVITLRMIPQSMLFQKPLDLRHICLFYLGHIPTFFDIQLSRLHEEPHTEPQRFKFIFERGIDPNFDDSSQCHPLSLVPQIDEGWSSLATILKFRQRVCERLTRIYSDISSGKRIMNRKLGRLLFMTYEHEAWHTETLLHILLQRAGSGTSPPHGFCPPPWDSLVTSWNAAPTPAGTTVTLDPATVFLSHNDLETDDDDTETARKVEGHEFGRDNEHFRRDVQVAECRIEWRPITNGQFQDFYKSTGRGQVQLPATWVEQDGEIKVRTLYGPVPMKVAQHWPVLTSYNDLSTYAIVKGGRLPTEAELRLFYDKFNCGYAGGANIGFRNWHPIPATTGVGKDNGRGHNGGVWEWTSTVFDGVDGFVPSEIYPGYSMDIFDGHHQVVIGGSYATVPRIAEKRSIRNWYQRNYAYPWAGARVVYSTQA